MEAISIKYSPVNQAWLVMWHDQVLRVFGGATGEADAKEYVDTLRPSTPYREERWYVATEEDGSWYVDDVANALHPEWSVYPIYDDMTELEARTVAEIMNDLGIYEWDAIAADPRWASIHDADTIAPCAPAESSGMPLGHCDPDMCHKVMPGARPA